MLALRDGGGLISWLHQKTRYVLLGQCLAINERQLLSRDNVSNPLGDELRRAKDTPIVVYELLRKEIARNQKMNKKKSVSENKS